MPKKFGKFNPLASGGKAVAGDVGMIEPEPEPEPIAAAPVEQGSEFKQVTVNTAEQNRYKSGNLQTRKINAEKVAAGSKGARATKALDVRAAKKEYFFIYEKRHLVRATPTISALFQRFSVYFAACLAGVARLRLIFFSVRRGRTGGSLRRSTGRRETRRAKAGSPCRRSWTSGSTRASPTTAFRSR